MDNMQCRLSSAVLPTGGKGGPLQQAGLQPLRPRERVIRELITVKKILLLSKSIPFLSCFYFSVFKSKREQAAAFSPLQAWFYTPVKGRVVFFPHNNDEWQHSLDAETSK